MSLRKRVAVVGGGPCGLGAIKALKEEDLEPVAFERTDNYGGLWCYREDEIDGVASVMKSTIINTSKELGAFSDFPPPAEFPNYMHNTLMHEYIGMAAKRFDLLRHITFNQLVVKVEPAEDYEKSGRWKVTTEDTRTKERKTEEFDGVMVCTGHHVFPNIPTFPGQEKFKGKIMHTHSLKKVNGFDDQRVAVVGVGNSGMDAAVEISNVAKNVYLSSRRGTWVLPRVGPKGHPFDAAFVRRYLIFMNKLVPERLASHFLERFLNERFNHTTYNLKPNHGVLSQHPTVSDTLPIKLLSGTVVVRNRIKEFTEDGVIFEKETEETKVDTVILATGYRFHFPFLDESILKIKDNRVPLYKFIYPPELPHATLAILGLIQPSGPGFPVGEMQCRWSARVMSGKAKLPSKEEMYADIRVKDELNRKKYVDSPRHTVQCDFIGFQDELAELIGAKPNFLKIAITDPKLFWALMMGPSLPYQYRLQGPGSWEGAREAILTYKERARMPLRKPGDPPYEPRSRWRSKFMFLIILTLIILLFSVFMKS